MITYFENIFTGAPEIVSLEKIIDDIRDGRWKTQVEGVRSGTFDKKKLPSVYFSGEFEGLTLDTISHYNNLIMIDIDKVKVDMKEAISLDRHTIICFRSPSGNGVKALFKTSLDASQHERTFEYIKEYLFNKFGAMCDVKAKNINRHCFMSWDPEIYHNPDFETFVIPDGFTPKQEWQQEKQKTYSGPVSASSECIFKRLVEWENERGRYLKGNRNQFIFNLICQCNRYGIPKDTTFRLVRLRYPSFSIKELTASLNSHYSLYSHDFSTKHLKIPKREVDVFD